MGFILSLAWKNLNRYRRRSLITSIAITAGIAVYIVADCMFSGIEQDSERNFIRYEAGAAQVMEERFFKEIDYLPLKYGIQNPGAVREALAPLGVRTTPRIRFRGELFHEYGSQQVMMEALDPATDGAVLRIRDAVKEGTYLGDDPSRILVGRLLADDLKADLGDTLTLRTRTRDGAFQTADFEIAGIIDSPNPYLNRGVGFVTLAAANDLLQMEGSVTEVLVGVDDWRQPEKLALSMTRALGGAFPGLIVKSWRDLGQDFINLVQTHMSIYNLLLFLVFVIAAVGISNTMLMAVYERFREIGMMRALGMQDGKLRLAFVLEACGIGMIGSLGGVLLGAILSFWMVHHGIDYSSLIGRVDMGYRINGVFRGAWNPSTMIRAFLFGILVSTAVSLIPASRALRKGITDCLRHV
jgi:ABC-type lipoprotein release transport system permease subunit